MPGWTSVLDHISAIGSSYLLFIILLELIKRSSLNDDANGSINLIPEDKVTMEFSLNVFTEFAEFSDKNIII